ncbi:MAG: hypothetical protein ACRYFR_04095 [Janthinobacterium lividum]
MLLIGPRDLPKHYRFACIPAALDDGRTRAAPEGDWLALLKFLIDPLHGQRYV